MGIDGETLSHNHGALQAGQRNGESGTHSDSDTHEKPKKSAAGRMIMMAVAMLTGRSRVFCSRPPQQKAVLPEKYW